MDDASTLVAVFLVAFVFIAFAIGAMALGSRMTGRCLRGSCGGPAVIGPDGKEIESCEGCPNRHSHRETRRRYG